MMASSLTPGSCEHPRKVVVSIEKPQQELIPPVELEHSEIIMSRPQDHQLPHIVTTTDEDSDETEEDADTIVGENCSLGSGSGAVSLEAAAVQTSKLLTIPQGEMMMGRLGTSSIHSDCQKRNSAHIMEFFEEQEKSFQEHFQTLPMKVKKQRSPSPSQMRQSVGLDHLENLVRLMEQLTQLRDENLKLKKRCAFLESTKYLLQVKSAMLDESSPLGYMSLPHKSKPKLQKANTDPEARTCGESPETRLRISHASDMQSVDITESASDQTPKRPKTAKLYKRSFSTGSLEIPSDITEQDAADERKTNFEAKGLKSGMASKLQSAKKKASKSSKWARVKKMLTGQKLLDDSGFALRALREFGRGSHLCHQSESSSKELTVPVVGITQSRSVDSGVGSGLDGDGLRASTSSGGPPSPSPLTTTAAANKDDDGLCTEIWMGPPGWEEKQANANNSKTKVDISGSISKKSGDQYQFLNVKMLVRRRSSPSLVVEGSDKSDKTVTGDEDSPKLHRSSSYKDPGTEEEEATLRDKKSHRTPWGRVKDMIHTRKDSLKKKYKKGEKAEMDSSRFEESSENDVEICCSPEERDDFSSPKLSELAKKQLEKNSNSKTSPQISPSIFRQKSSKNACGSPQRTKMSPSKFLPGPSSVDVSALVGCMSDDFTKKMQEWEELKSKQTHDISKGSQKIKNDANSSSEDIADELSSPVEACSPPVNMDEIQRSLTESFNRKLREWEKIKYRKEGSPSLDPRGLISSSMKARKEEKIKVKKSKLEKDKDKMLKFEKIKERELLKVEREQHKLEKEKIRLEKERLRALEREAKIEKMKGRLSQADIDTKFTNPILGPLAEYKITTKFARKLHEWELMKGLSHDVSTALYLEAQQWSLQLAREYHGETSSVLQKAANSEVFLSGNSKSKKPKPAPLCLPMPASWDSPDEASPVDRVFPHSSSETSFDESATTDESLTKANIAGLENANIKLLEELHQKELEYLNLQEEVKELHAKLTKFKEEHSKEIARYKRELQMCARPGRLSVESKAMSSTMSELEDKIQELESFGEKLTVSLESAAICKLQSMEGEESISDRLMELMEQMKLMLVEAVQTEEVSQKSSALHNFEKLYCHSLQLQIQMNNLRLSHLQRNKEIMDMKRQLLLQEVNNLLLQADITRRETELVRYHEAKRRANLKRWNTYHGGMEQRMRVVEGCEDEDKLPLHRFTSLKEPSMKGSLINRSDSESDEDRQIASQVKRTPCTDGQFSTSSEISGLTSSASSRKDTLLEHCPRTPVSPSDLQHPVETQADSYPNIPMKSISSKVPLSDTSEEHIETASTPSGVTGHGMNNSDQSHIAISFTISLPTMNVQIPQTISTSSQTTTPGSTTFISCKSATFHANGSAVQSTTASKSPIVVHSLQEDTKFYQGESLADWLKREPKCPELDIPECVIEAEQISLPTSTKDERIDLNQFTDLGEQVSIEQHTDKIFTPANLETGASTCDNEKGFSKKGDTKKKAMENSINSEQSTPVDPSKLDTEVQPPDSFSTQLLQSVSSRPVKEKVKNYERQTFSEAAQSRLQIRKSPSPTVNIPQIGIVSPIRRLKPATELLQECQKYRMGHTASRAHMHLRGSLTEDQRAKNEDKLIKTHDKENMSEGYVQSIVKRLSREGTPSSSLGSDESTPKAESCLSLQRSDSPRSQSELVQHIVQKLSSPIKPEQPKLSTPLKDLTNEGHVKKLTETFDNGSIRNFQESSQSDRDARILMHKVNTTSRRGSCELPKLSAAMQEFPQTTLSASSSAVIQSSCAVKAKPDSTISVTNSFSLPALSSAVMAGDGQVGRSATCESFSLALADRPNKMSGPELEESQTFPQEELLDVGKNSSSRKEKLPLALSSETIVVPKQHAYAKPEIRRLPSPKSSGRQGGKTKMGTIGVLCQQTMSFDLGVSLQTSKVRIREKTSQSSRSQSGIFSERPKSLSSLDEGCSCQTEDKRRPRSRFLDSSWFQKSKKLFKVSK